MKFWAITNKTSLKTMYLGIHDSAESAWQIFLGWPGPDEIQRAKLKFVCEEVAIFPIAQACRPPASPQPGERRG
jgi:hypothetical protein